MSTTLRSIRDTNTLRRLTDEYLDASSPEKNDAKRALWKDHHSLRSTTPPVLCRFGIHNAWAYKLFAPQLTCSDPVLRGIELKLRIDLFHAEIGDDHVFEPWVTCPAVHAGIAEGRAPWGIPLGKTKVAETSVHVHASPLTSFADIDRISGVGHVIAEAQTQEHYERIAAAVGEMIEIEIDRGPLYRSFRGDISTDIAELRGLENLMMDTYLHPEEVHRLLAKMRDIVLESHDVAEAHGDLRSSTQRWTQDMPYSHETPEPRVDDEPRHRDELWYFAAAQEYTLISPAMHDEFLLQYQLPILSKYKYVQYGCCENLTRKIDMLRQIPNLRVIAVTPSADVRQSVESIDRDYCMSWRPNPTDMICSPGFDPEYVASTVKRAADIMRDHFFSVCLKDVETVHGAPDRWKSWLEITKKAVGR